MSKKQNFAVNAALPTLKPGPRRFVTEFLRDMNATQAYIRAGYKARGHAAEASASKLLRKAEIQSAIAHAQNQMVATVQAETGITLARTVRELARIAFFDPRLMFHADGRPKLVTELDDDTAAVIAGIDVLEKWEGTGENTQLVGLIKKWKLADKKGALDLLMKHLGGYEVDNEQKKPELVDQLAEFIGGLHQSGACRLSFGPRRA